MQYFYDEEKSTLNIVDLQFPSATRGVAVGDIVEGQPSEAGGGGDVGRRRALAARAISRSRPSPCSS